MIALVENLVIFVVGLVWAIRRRERVWGDMSFVLIVLCLAVAIETVTGFLHMELAEDAKMSAAHRWIAHALVALAWCSAVSAIGATIASIRRSPVAAIGSGSYVIAVALLVILESFTGYLGKTLREGQLHAEETSNRFYLLHCAMLPCVTLAVTAAGALLLRRVSRRFSVTGDDSEPTQVTKSDNPYASPGGDQVGSRAPS